MSFEEELGNFVKSSNKLVVSNLKKIPPNKKNIISFINDHKKAISVGLDIAKGLRHFYEKGSPAALAETAFNVIKNNFVDEPWDIYSYFKQSDGWKNALLACSSIPLDLFNNILFRFPSQQKQMNSGQMVTIYFTPIGRVGFFKGYNNSWFLNLNEYTAEQFIDFLVSEKFKEFDTNFIYYHTDIYAEKDSKVQLVAEHLRYINTKNSDYYVAKIRKYVEHGVCRSIIFYGPPGTGKTTLAQTIVHELNYRTLRISLKDFNPLQVSFFIKYFKFEALLIDDIDQLTSNNNILDFLEKIRPNIKVIIATANQLKDFHPAVVRPGRFDQIIKIDHLDRDKVDEILGPLAEKYGDKVASWSVAYINELVLRSKFYEEDDLDIHYKELNDRIELQNRKLEDK